jgi:alpha/beta superfamily hydrolase
MTKPAALMPSAEVVTIEGADHFFSGKARPALLRQALAFLQAHTAS